MHEMTLLSAMRAEMPEPDASDLAGTESRLLEAMTTGRAPARAAGRSRRPRPAVRLALAGAVAAVAVAAVGAGLAGRPATVDRPAGSTVDAANLRLVAAVDAMARTSYRLRVTSSMPQTLWPAKEGAYDPVGRKGYLRSTAAAGTVWEFRLIGDDGYSGMIRKDKTPKFLHLTGVKGFPMLLGVGSGTDGSPTVDPTDLLQALKSHGSLEDLGRSGNGAGAVHTYVVSTDTNTQAGHIIGSTTVAVGVDSGKVSKVSFETRIADQDPLTMTLQFSDYGTPVNVERP